jgi:hypothetical protein
MRRNRETPRIDFEQHPELISSLGRSATIPRMIGELPRVDGDTRETGIIDEAHGRRFVRQWYQAASFFGRLATTEAAPLVVRFGLAPDETDAQLLLANTAVLEELSMFDPANANKDFPGFRARFRDIIDPPKTFRLHGVGQPDDVGYAAYTMRYYPYIA